MSEYIAVDGDRLDVVVFRAYESLEPFSMVLEANPHLQSDEVLKAGEIVYLPEWRREEKEEVQALWS